METEILIEIFGYIGSALVVFSMLMTSVMKLRIINTLGSVVSFIYAMICHTYPIAVMNLALIIINLYGMKKLMNTSPEYHMELADSQDAAVRFLLKKYAADIRKFFPNFSSAAENQKAYVVMNGDVCVGVALGTLKENSLELALDYTTPSYRDFSIGPFLYGKLKEQGIGELTFVNPADTHKSYLVRMGFEEKDGKFVKTL